MLVTQVNLNLPDWVHTLEIESRSFPSDADKMNLAIQLSGLNVERGTGGPFGAAIFDTETHKVVSIGVNRVIPLTNSTAHAEMMAFMLAQARFQSPRLSAENHQFTLATSAQPCSMCFGASPWAGISRMIIGARKEDVENLTEFDEGPIPENWIEELNKRGISVTTDILRKNACDVLDLFTKSSGIHY